MIFIENRIGVIVISAQLLLNFLVMISSNTMFDMISSDGQYQEYRFDYDYFLDQVSVISITRTILRNLYDHSFISTYIRLLPGFICLTEIETFHWNYRSLQICCSCVFSHFYYPVMFPTICHFSTNTE